MPTATPSPSHSTPASWGVALAATSVLLIGGGALVWAHREPPEPIVVEAASTGSEGAWVVRPYPEAIDDAVFFVHGPVSPTRVRAAGPVHSVSYAVENGVQVVKIRVVPDGDELVIDAATGRLIETRPNRPTGPPPVGRNAAPFVPPT